MPAKGQAELGAGADGVSQLANEHRGGARRHDSPDCSTW